MTTLNILLIDKRVSQYEDIVAAVDPALAVGIVFDYYEDTFETIKTRMGEFGLTNITAVGLIQHNYRAPMFTMLASADVAPVAQVATQDPELERWTQFRDFITWCKTELNTAHFDMMACALYSDPDWKHVIDTLTAQTGVTVRASTDDTGAASMGGDWFLESHTGVNLKNVYFTEAIEAYRGILYLDPWDIREYPTKGFAGSIQLWGDTSRRGTDPNITGGVVAVAHTENGSFAALKTDGSIQTWGGWSEINPGISGGAVAVYSTTAGAFAALKSDGSVVAWGSSFYGGIAPVSVTAPNSGVVTIYSYYYTFAAIKGDGSVVVWGDPNYGGTTPDNVSSGVVAIYPGRYAFAALKSNGSVVAWGNTSYGGANPGISGGVVAVYSTEYAFAALKSDGSIQAWGDSGNGGIAPVSVTAPNSGVVMVCSSSTAFAALKTDGSIQAWGDSGNGGIAPVSVTAPNSGVVTVCSSATAFAALKNDGSVVAWGSNMNAVPSSVTAANSGIVAIYSTSSAFAALKSNGSVVAWGNSNWGGNDPGITGGVVAIYPNSSAFAALKSNGSVQVWGYSDYGGTDPGISSGVVAVYPQYVNFAALKTTATTFDLSFSYYRDIDRYDILRKKENRRRVNLTTLNNNVFTLSAARDIQSFNPTMPTNKSLRIIVPTYVASSYSITSTATIPSGAENVIIACDESEPVTISGTTYVNYGAFVYMIDASGSYVKTTSTTINQRPYSLYGGDGVYSSGIALLDARTVPTLTLTTFSVASNKTVGDASFNDFTRPTSDSSSAIIYSSSNTAVATIDASGTWITLVGAGDVNFIATQEGNATYAGATKTSNTLTVERGTTTLARSAMDATISKTFGIDISFNVVVTSDSSGAVTYTSSAPEVATVGLSTGLVTPVSAGQTTITAQQAQSAQYNVPTSITSVLTVLRGTTSLARTAMDATISKTFGIDISFNVVATSDSSGAVTYTSSAPQVATVGLNTGLVTPVSAGQTTITAQQAQSAQYNVPTSITSVLTVSRRTTSLTSFSVAGSKTFGAAPFSIDTVSMSDSSGAITYSSDASGVAIITSSSGIITLVAAGTATFTASQAQSAQYNAPTPVTSNTLTVSKVTPTLVFVNPPASKSLTDAAFTVTATSGILFSVSNSGSGAYVINGSSNPTLTVIRGMRYILSVNASGHPFWIQTVSGAYSGGNIYSNSSIVNNGEDVGNIIWEVAFDTPTTLYYACQYHSSMQGVINVV